MSSSPYRVTCEKALAQATVAAVAIRVFMGVASEGEGVERGGV
jgi:hypothetical protein